MDEFFHSLRGAAGPFLPHPFQTSFEQLAQIDFIIATTLATTCTFTVAFIMGLVLGRGRIGEATLAGFAGGFGNVGYMGPGPALATLGPEAAVPVALVFCFDAVLIFVLVPLLMTFSKAGNIRVGRAQQLPALCVLLATAGWCGVRLMQLFLKLGKSWLIILISSRH